MIYPVSLLAIRFVNHVNNTNHAAVLIEAASEDEATGKGWRTIERLYPLSDGWNQRDVQAGKPNVVEPETATWIS